MRTLVVTAMTREARAVGPSAMAVGAGARSRDGLRQVLAVAGADVMIVAGICGALDPSLAPGAVVLASSVVADGKPGLDADARLRDVAFAALLSERRRGSDRAGGADSSAIGRPTDLVCAKLLTVAAASAGPDERRALWRDTGAAAIDMETYPLAEIAIARGMPWLAIRTVSDAASARLPAPIATWRSEEDDWRVALAVARRPSDWPSAARLAWDTRTALRSLARVAAIVVDAIECRASPLQSD